MSSPADARSKVPASGLSLYHFDTCPFCVRVRQAAAGLDLELELRDISRDPERRRELVEATRSQQVPCLRIESDSGEVEWMHESADIIAYLRERFA